MKNASYRKIDANSHPRTTIYDKICISPTARDLIVVVLCALFLGLVFFAALR